MDVMPTGDDVVNQLPMLGSGMLHVALYLIASQKSVLVVSRLFSLS